MKFIKRLSLFLVLGFVLLVAGFDIWGAMTLGTLEPATNPSRDNNANRVVAVFGATGSVGDGLLKATIEDPDVDKIYVVTRSSSARIDESVASAKVEMILHQDFTDYAAMTDILPHINTVLWGLGTTSIGMDDATYTLIHVDFPVAFVKAWLQARRNGPMSFHYITGMGTDLNGEEHWAREKGRAEREVAVMADASELRTFAYRSAFVRPTSEQANAFHYFLETLLKPGSLVISATELGNAMLEISARTTELPNGTLIDNKDSILYARAHPNYR